MSSLHTFIYYESIALTIVLLAGFAVGFMVGHLAANGGDETEDAL